MAIHEELIQRMRTVAEIETIDTSEIQQEVQSMFTFLPGRHEIKLGRLEELQVWNALYASLKCVTHPESSVTLNFVGKRDTNVLVVQNCCNKELCVCVCVLTLWSESEVWTQFMHAHVIPGTQGTADDLKNHVPEIIPPPNPQRMNSGGSRAQNYGQAKLLFAIKKVRHIVYPHLSKSSSVLSEWNITVPWPQKLSVHLASPAGIVYIFWISNHQTRIQSGHQIGCMQTTKKHKVWNLVAAWQGYWRTEGPTGRCVPPERRHRCDGMGQQEAADLRHRGQTRCGFGKRRHRTSRRHSHVEGEEALLL